MKYSLDSVDDLVAIFKRLKPLNADAQQKLDKKFRLEFNFNSNHLEGNTLSYGETELLLIFDDTRGNHSMREYEEMKAHDAAYLLVDEWAKDKERPLTEQNIKNLNEIILVRPFWKDAITADGQTTRRKIKVGNYKEHPNSVRLQNGELFEYASPTETPIMMQELIDWYRSEENAVHPVNLAAMLHYKFVRVHPFDDGNGRIARLLMNYVLLKNDFPPVVIKSKEKAQYLRALHAADVGDYETFIEYIAEQVAWSLEISIRAAMGDSIEEPEDWEKELVLLKQELGQEKDTKVEVKYSREAYETIYKHVLKPLTDFWESKMKVFDSLFRYGTRQIERKMFVDNATFYGNSFQDTWKKFSESSIDNNNTIKSLIISCDFKSLISADDDKRFSGGAIHFNFHNNVYDFRFNGVLRTRSYNEFITSEEINEIVNTFSRYLMQSIKKANT